MANKDTTTQAFKLLERVHAFFPRAEGKASFIFAFDTALLGSIALNLQKSDVTNWITMVAACTAVVLLSASIYHVYATLSHGALPNLK
jgi:hypothetical protein